MTAPADNYDAYTIVSAPYEMYNASAVINASAVNISNYLSSISKSLSDLRLSWTGTSASLAQEFSTRWANAATALYGNQDDPNSGILNQLTNGLALAAQNYHNNEHVIAGMFNQYSSLGTSSGPGDVKDKVTNNYYHTTSVDETF